MWYSSNTKVDALCLPFLSTVEAAASSSLQETEWGGKDVDAAIAKIILLGE